MGAMNTAERSAIAAQTGPGAYGGWDQEASQVAANDAGELPFYEERLKYGQIVAFCLAGLFLPGLGMVAVLVRMGVIS